MSNKKHLIAKKTVKGGLLHMEQEYALYYVEQDKDLCDKAELNINIKKKSDNSSFAKRCLRFNSTSQFKQFIKDMARLLAVFEYCRGIDMGAEDILMAYNEQKRRMEVQK